MKIFARLSDIEQKMKTAMSADVVNDMMNAVQKISEVLGRVNLGKLEVTFKEAGKGLEAIKDTLDSVMPKMKEFAEIANSIKTIKVEGSSPQSSTDAARVTESLKQEGKQARLTREEYEKLRFARASEVKRETLSSGRTEGMRRMQIRKIGALPDDGSNENLSKAIQLFSTLRNTYEYELTKLEESGQRKGVRTLNGITEMIGDLVALMQNSLKIGNPKKVEDARGYIRSIMDTITMIEDGTQDDPSDAVSTLLADVRALEKISGISANFGVKETSISKFVSSILQDRERISDLNRAAKIKESEIFGVDFSEYEKLIRRAGELNLKYEETVSKGKTFKKKDITELGSLIDDMDAFQAKMGVGIQTEEWDAAFNKMKDLHRELVSVKSEAKQPDSSVTGGVAETIGRDAEKAEQKLDGLEKKAKETSEVVTQTAETPQMSFEEMADRILGTDQAENELEQVEEKTEQTGKVIAQLDDKFIETFTNIGHSITDLIGKMDKLYDEGIKVSNVFDQADGVTPPWADWFKETTGQQGIADMNDGVLMLVESLDKLTGQMTHVVQIINRLFLNNGSNAFFDDARAGIEMMIDGLIALGDKADQTQTELSRLGGVNTGIDASTMQQLIDAAVMKGAQSADTLNRKLAQQKKIMNEIFALQDMRNKGMGDAQKIQERLVKLGQQYAKNMKDMQGMDGYDEAEETLRHFIQDKVAKVDYKDTQAEIKGLENAVRRLAKAQNEYISAVKIGNTEGARRAQDEIEDAKEEIRLRDEVVQKLKLTTEQEERRKKA